MPDEEMLDPTVATIAALARRPAPLSAEARARVRLAIESELVRGRPGSPRRRFGWLVESRPVPLSPLAGMALAAGLVGIGVVLSGLAGLAGLARRGDAPAPAGQVVAEGSTDDVPAVPPTAPTIGGATPAGAPIVPVGARAAAVKFVLVAPQARHVTVVGDFNAWDPSAHPMERVGGTWTVTVPLEAGRHEYSFVVDGTHWMPDPAAPLAPDDGFGVNSVLLVSRSTS